MTIVFSAYLIFSVLFLSYSGPLHVLYSLVILLEDWSYRQKKKTLYLIFTWTFYFDKKIIDFIEITIVKSGLNICGENISEDLQIKWLELTDNVITAIFHQVLTFLKFSNIILIQLPQSYLSNKILSRKLDTVAITWSYKKFTLCTKVLLEISPKTSLL